MGLAESMRINASGMTAQRLRLDTISNNLANVNTTHGLDGGAYKRQMPVFQAMYPSLAGPGGVRVAGIIEDKRQGKLSYEPGHPDANAEGYVEYPNVNTITEMADMIAANRTYEANVTAMQAIKSMALKALELGRA